MKKTPKKKDRLFHLNLIISGLESTILLAALRAYLDQFSTARAAPEMEALMYKVYNQLTDQIKLVPDFGRAKKP